VVLAADTVVAVDRMLLGKPRDAGDARRMLRLLSGRTHRVITGLATCRAGGAGVRSAEAMTWVTFAPLTRREIDWYVASGDPMDKAGAYGIQGGAGLFVTRIRGSYSNVVGLPLDLVYRMLGLPA
jgi:nucleoside triphosphate pyrophosphatase